MEWWETFEKRSLLAVVSHLHKQNNQRISTCQCPLSIHYSWCQEMYNNNSLCQFWVIGKPAGLILRLLFGFASDLSNSTKYLQVVRWQCCLRLVEWGRSWCTYSGRKNSGPFVNVVYGQCQVMYTTAPTYSLLAGIERLTQKHEISKLWFQTRGKHLK